MCKGTAFVGVLTEWVEDCRKKMNHGYNIMPPQYIVWGSPAGVDLPGHKVCSMRLSLNFKATKKH